MAELVGIIGHFESADALRAAVKQAREAQLDNITAYLPLPDDSELHAVDPADSRVRWFGLAGGLSGIATAVAMTTFCSWNYPLVVGGKDIVTWPPFLVICFELMVLFGTFGALTGFLILARLPHMQPEAGYAPELAVDTFGLFVPCRDRGSYRVMAEGVLRDAGAEAIRNVYR